MKLKFNFPPKSTNKQSKEDRLIRNSEDPDFIPDKEVFSILSDPEFAKTFPDPSSFQYTTLKFNFTDSKESATNSLSYLKKFIETNDKSISGLIRFSQFLHTALGNKSSVKFIAQKEEKVKKILEKGFKDISSSPKTNYFTGILLNPDILLKKTESFEKAEKDLTPVQVSNDYFIQDNGFDPIPIFYHIDNSEEFNSLILKQSEFFKNVRPENRPNPNFGKMSLSELKEFKEKYLDSTINFDEKKSEIREKIDTVARRLSPEEIMAFFPDSKNIYELTQDPLLLEFRVFNNPEIRQQIEKEFGISLKEIPMKEQVYFLTSILKKTNESIRPAQNFSKKFGLAGVKTFLSVEHGGKEMGDKILELSEKLPKDSADILFKTYGEMVDATAEIEALIIDNLGEKATPDLINQTKEALLLGGKKLLESYAKKASTCKDIECENLGKELEEHLSLAKKSIFAFSYACKTLAESGEFNFEDFKKAKLSYDKSPIPEKMQKEIIAMHHENTKQYPDTLKEKWRGTLKEGLEKENSKQMIVSVSYEESVVSAMRVIEQDDGSWYGASFNVNPTVMGSRIGSELLKKVLEDLAKNKPFVADCYAENPMLKTYTEKFGFEITKTYENYENTGVKVYQITLSPKK
ncbi:MAG: GNAT family N-acetyltransferase [Patescibacteria group bacterium]